MEMSSFLCYCWWMNWWAANMAGCIFLLCQNMEASWVNLYLMQIQVCGWRSTDFDQLCNVSICIFCSLAARFYCFDFMFWGTPPQVMSQLTSQFITPLETLMLSSVFIQELIWSVYGCQNMTLDLTSWLPFAEIVTTSIENGTDQSMAIWWRMFFV